MKTNNRMPLYEQNESSDEVKEMLGKAPRWMVRWGISVVLVSVLLILLGTAFIRYNDIIFARVTITTSIPPAYLKARTSGRLTQLLAKADQRVKAEQVLAEIENTASFDDVQAIRHHLEKLSTSRIRTIDSLLILFPPDLQAGTVQQEYNNFLTQFQNYILFNDLAPNIQEIRVVSSQIEEQRALLKNQQQQLALYRQELALSEKSFQRSKTLYEHKVISALDFESASKAFLSDRQRLEGMKVSISNTLIAISSLVGSRTKSGIRDAEATRNYQQQLEESIQRLKNAILNWEQLYLIKTPIDGVVTLFDIWNKNQNINSGETLFTVVPDDDESLIGKLTLPMQNSGKVKTGQHVIIKLDNYAYAEWGSLRGKIINISAVPKQGAATYTIYIDIDSLITSFNKKLEFRQEMEGNAEIITEELTVMQRIFYQVRKVFERKSRSRFRLKPKP